MNEDELIRRLRQHGEHAPGVPVDRERVWGGVRRRRQRVVATTAAGTAAVVALGVAVGAGGGGALAPGRTDGVPPGPDGVAQAAVEHRGVVLALEPGDLTARDVARAQTEFGLDLLHAVCAEKPGENVVLSPTSAAQALGMVQAAGDAAAEQAFADLLHLPSWSPDLVAALHEHTAALERLDVEDGDAVRVSNRMWTAHGLEPEQEYLDAIRTSYDASIGSLDFADDPDGSTDHVNDAVANDTSGLIRDLFPTPIRRDTQALLTNAVHLEATWATPFDRPLSGDFATPDGDVPTVLMSGGSGSLQKADGWAAVEIPYEDGTLSALAVLPPEGTDPCETDVEELDDLRGTAAVSARVTMPRLLIEQTHALRDVLVELGMPREAVYPGFGTEQPLEITRVVQKTYLRVDENGTEAAAATGVEGVAVSGTSEAQITLDRPFLLVLTDTATRSPLFVAAIQDPTQN